MTTTPVVNADVDNSPPSLRSRLIAEAFGTFLLVTAVIGAALFSAPTTGILAPAIAVGLGVMGAAYAVGHISGGHFNPAVSLGAAAAGRFEWRDVLPYIAAQLVGSFLASSVLIAVRMGIDSPVVNNFSAVSNGWGKHSSVGANMFVVILFEAVLTALFLLVVLGVTDRRAPTGFAPIAIGLTLTALHVVAIPVTNASFNPARSIATAIYGGPEALVQLWVFIVAPVAGALLAGFAYRPLFDRAAPVAESRK